MPSSCTLCQVSWPVDLIASTPELRVVWAQDAQYPCFIRVVWHDHVKEMTDLSTAERGRMMDAVFAVELAMQQVLKPDKINLASFGNRTPHLHWHVIPRWANDAHWPEPNWAAPQRQGLAYGLEARDQLAQAVLAQLGSAGLLV